MQLYIKRPRYKIMSGYLSFIIACYVNAGCSVFLCGAKVRAIMQSQKYFGLNPNLKCVSKPHNH